MIQRRVVHIHRDNDRSLQAAWNQASKQHPIAHAMFRFGVLLWKAIILLACFGMITGGLWILIALFKAATS
jgi:hypothetical protein